MSIPDKSAKPFLAAIVKAGGEARYSQLPLVTKAEENVRQACRKAGYAVREGNRWKITDAGRGFLQTLESQPGQQRHAA